VVLVGGAAHPGALVGVFCVNASIASSTADSLIGARLCLF